MDMSLSKLQEMEKDGKPGMLQSMESPRVTPKQHKATRSLISNATLPLLDSELTDYS